MRDELSSEWQEKEPQLLELEPVRRWPAGSLRFTHLQLCASQR